ncbi:unnamed protein product [marine sediment metagenome]|uniref:Uncharacterized protein n=1 Tax=marine sediment metagenome TaxID=412755 RepID=X1IH12_9ZZZZ
MNYKGNGEVILTNNEIYKCSFELYQKEDGRIFLLCKFTDDNNSIPSLILTRDFNAKQFKGKTTNDFECYTEKMILGDFPNIPNSEDCIMFYLYEIEIITSNKSDENGFCFKITNFCLNKFDNFELSLPNFFQGKNKKLNFLFKPLDNYEEINRNLRINRNVEVTSEIIYINNENLFSIEQIIEVIDDICHILSIANGTKIQWTSYKFNKDSYVHESI